MIKGKDGGYYFTELLLLRYAAWCDARMEWEVYDFFVKQRGFDAMFSHKIEDLFCSATKIFPDAAQRRKFYSNAIALGWVEINAIGCLSACDSRFARGRVVNGDHFIEYNVKEALKVMGA